MTRVSAGVSLRRVLAVAVAVALAARHCPVSGDDLDGYNHIHSREYRTDEKPAGLDLTRSCARGKRISRFLPYGVGVADADVSFISSTNKQYPPNCTLTYEAPGSLYSCFIMVIELRKEDSKNRLCNDPRNRLLVVSNLEEIDVCSWMLHRKATVVIDAQWRGATTTDAYDAYWMVSLSDAHINISAVTFYETLKVTVTSARRVTSIDSCNLALEVHCAIGHVSVCISKELECDDNINCGQENTFDEDYRVCRRVQSNWTIVLAIIAMFLVILGLVLNLMYMCVPKIPENFFIFNEDEDNRLVLASQLLMPSARQVAHYRMRTNMILQQQHQKQRPREGSIPATSDIFKAVHQRDEVASEISGLSEESSSLSIHTHPSAHASAHSGDSRWSRASKRQIHFGQGRSAEESATTGQDAASGPTPTASPATPAAQAPKKAHAASQAPAPIHTSTKRKGTPTAPADRPANKKERATSPDPGQKKAAFSPEAAPPVPAAAASAAHKHHHKATPAAATHAAPDAHKQGHNTTPVAVTHAAPGGSTTAPAAAAAAPAADAAAVPPTSSHLSNAGAPVSGVQDASTDAPPPAATASVSAITDDQPSTPRPTKKWWLRW